MRSNQYLIKSSIMRKIHFLSLLSLSALMLVSCSKNDELIQDQPVILKNAVVKTVYPMVPNEILLKFKVGTEASKKDFVLAKLNGKLKEKILTKMMEKEGDKEGIELISISGNVLDALAQVKNIPELEYAEPNFIYTHQSTSNDPYFTNGSLWGMNGTYGSQASMAWAANHTGSADVYVGIIDEGYMYNHTDLTSNAGVNIAEKNGQKNIDDDGNGCIDDIYGWDFNSNDNSVFDGVNDDHGTHVAGTIGGTGNNGIGVAGVCWTVKMLGAKFLGTNGGTTANAIKAVDYFTNLKLKGLNLVATNNSWGGGGFSQGLFDAISRANTAGVLFVAAAGNNGTNNDLIVSYPSNYDIPNIISVAAIDKFGALASFSQYGATTVDLAAPGVSILSTVPVKSGKNITSGFASYNGTSMATPHVTGACALYKASHPTAQLAEIKAAILNNSTLTNSLSGKCLTGGRLNISGF
jgi:subtilisin family serine protease